MRNVFFPHTIIDGFFEHPDAIRKLALEQEYVETPGQNFPGKRSKKTISEIDPLVWDTIMFKFLDNFFTREEVKGFAAYGKFQLVNKKFVSGWIHRDVPSVATGLIYLTPEDHGDPIGTSLYEKKNVFDDPNTYENRITKDKFDTPSKHNNLRKAHNEKYKEIISVSGMYNRLFVFDSHYYHGAQNFIGEDNDDSRLTIVFFIYGINTARYPIQKMNHQSITIL